MEIKSILSQLSQHNIKLDLIEGKLDLIVPKGINIPTDLIEKIRSHKEDLIAYIESIKEHTITIEKIEEQEAYDLSSAQERLWLVCQDDVSSSAYNMALAFNFKGRLDIAILSASFEFLIKRHDALRTTFKKGADGIPKQYISPPSDFTIHVEDFSDHANPKERILQAVAKNAEDTFDLEQGPLFRLKIHRENKDKHTLSFVIHHIVSDAWSLEVIIQELLGIYNELLRGIDPVFPDLEIQYKDYAAWLRKQLTGLNYEAHKAYWLKTLSGELPILALNEQKERPLKKSFNGAVVTRHFDPQTQSELSLFVKKQESTLYTALFTVLKALLYRYTSQPDFIIGCPTAGRPVDDLKNQIGFFVNTIALRTNISPEMSFVDLFKDSKATITNAFKHDIFPFEQLVEELNPQRDPGRSPIFDIMLVLQNVSLANQIVETGLEGLEIEPFSIVGNSSKFDLTFSFIENEKTIVLDLEYNTDLFTRSFISQLAAHFEQLAVVLISNSNTPLLHITFLKSEERTFLLETVNNTKTNYPENTTVIGEFETQVEKNHNKIALITNEKKLTYGTLNYLSDNLAHYLWITEKVKSEDFIVVKLERSEWMMIAILAILKLKCTYVPLDPDTPDQRTEFVIKDCKSNLIIDESWIVNYQLKSNESNLNFHPPKAENELAYLMYTSGTTGQPKGVLIKQESIIRLVKSPNFIELYQEDKLLVTGSPAFDSVTFEYWSMLLNGGTLVLRTKQELLNPNNMKEIIISENINLMWLTASWFNQLLDEDETIFNTLDRILIGGDKLSVEHIKKLRKAHPEIKIINGYGPTENTTFSLCADVVGKDITDIPIGKPINNSQVYILDDFMNLQPINVTGEIVVGGEGLANGYLNLPEETSEKFVDNPFVKGTKLYKTGDLGFVNSQGEVHFKGRKDDQIKIRGYRIEPSEIESILKSNEHVEKACVIVVSLSNEKELAAYYTSKNGIDSNELRKFLKSKLPKYMIPTYLIKLDNLPLTVNGKVNKKALPAPDLSLSSINHFAKPLNEVQEKISIIWRGILNRDKIGLNDDFFDLGGHSLKLARLIVEYQKQFDVLLEMKDLFSQTTIEDHEALISGAEKNEYEQIKPVKLAADYPISDGQRRLWVLSQFDDASIAYNIPNTLYLNGNYNLNNLKKAINQVIDRHEILRTVFTLNENGEIRQKIKSRTEIKFEIKVIDYRNKVNPKREAENDILFANKQLFDLSKGPLIKIDLFHLAPNQYILYVNMHHIISDGWSENIFVQEILEFYNALQNNVTKDFLNLNIQYKDYSAWQQNNHQKPKFQKEKEFWINHLRGELTVFNLPSSKVRPKVKTYNGRLLQSNLLGDLTNKIITFSKENEGSLFMVLLTTWNVLFARYTGQEETIIGSPVAGRNHADLENQIGFYVNTIVLRNRIDSTKNFVENFNLIKNSTIAAYAHQDYPFDRLVEDLNTQKDTSRSALFDVLLTLQNTGEVNKNENLFQKIPPQEIIVLGETNVKFDLEIEFLQERDSIQFIISYNSDIYQEDVITNLMLHFKALLFEAISNPNKSVGELNFLSSAEYNELTLKYNRNDVTFDKNKTILDYFRIQVEENPEKVALQCESEQMSYLELDHFSNQLAHYLKINYNIKPDDLIGIKLNRSNWIVVAMLGILKSGGAYVPIDTDYPEKRIEYIQNDSACKVCIDSRELEIFLDQKNSYDQKFDYSGIKPQNLAYVIYTSGTTGHPKGVLLEHKNLVRLFFNAEPLFDFSNMDVWCMFHSYCFDFSVWEIYGALLFGGKLIIPTKLETRDSLAFSKLLSDQHVTILNQTPSAFKILQEIIIQSQDSFKIRYVIFGGEALSPFFLKNWNEHFPNCQLINMYGITETTVHVTYKEVTRAEIDSNVSNIGKPIPTMGCFVLDQNRQLVPFNVLGELYIDGDGVARGYLNRPELTADRFVNIKLHGKKTSRMYRSGDLALRNSSGELEYYGRIDNQVKIRGHRIELKEIEFALVQIEEIKEAIVIAREAELIAYLIAEQDQHVTNLRKHLKTVLPEYMIPAYYVQMDDFPITSNGKLDLSAMPNPQKLALESGTEYVAPRNELEENLVELWKTYFQQERIGIKHDYFVMGGDSIKAIQLVFKMNQLLDETQITLANLYANPTIEELSHLIENQNETTLDEKLLLENTRNIIDELEKDVFLTAKKRGLATDNWTAAFPMSAIQKGMVFHNMMEKGAYIISHNEQFIDKDFDISLFKKVLSDLIEKHEILRTSFYITEFQREIQIVHNTIDLNDHFNYLDCRNLTEADQKIDLNELMFKKINNGFDLDKPGLWQIYCVQLSDDKFILMFIMHHAIIDGWSYFSLVTELTQHYSSLKTNGQQTTIEVLKSTYKDYIIQQELAHRNEKAKHFWLENLADFEKPTLPFNKKDITIADPEVLIIPISDALKSEVDQFLSENKLTKKAFYLSVLIELMRFTTNENDITIGLASNGRPVVEDSQKVIGCFTNAIPFRFQVNYNEPLLQAVENKLRELKAFELFSNFEIKNLLKENLNYYGELYDVMYNYTDFYVTDGVASAYTDDRSLVDGYEKNNSPLALEIVHFQNDYTIFFSIYSGLYSTVEKELLSQYTIAIIKRLIGLNESKNSYLSESELQQQLIRFNQTKEDQLKKSTLLKLFEEQVAIHPKNVAVVFNERKLTYIELDKAANQLANCLKSRFTINSEDIIGIHLDRSEQWVIAILAIFKLGAAYLPIDTDYPEARKTFLIEDSKLTFVISDTNRNVELEDNTDWFYLNNEALENYPVEFENANLNSNNLAYIIYTSGSTGNPKGVMIEHGGISNTIVSQIKQFGIEPETIGLQFASYSFDASVYEIFIPILAGGQLHIANNEQRSNPELLETLIATNKINLATLPPAYFKLLNTEKIAGIKTLITAGESPDRNAVKRFIEYGDFVNAYGPTEVSICASTHKIMKNCPIIPEVIPIGKPIENCRIYILDQNGELLPQGVTGEICVAGIGLARGYLNREDLTTEKFVQNKSIGENRLYKTGDFGRWLSNGELEFVGRSDDQVKIRGYRIELGEIELALANHKTIIQSSILARRNGTNENELIAYFKASETINQANLVGFLRNNLPEYSIPTHFIQINEFPLTKNGKIDKKALKENFSQSIVGSENHISPITKEEKDLIRIWENILNKTGIGMNDNFFMLGGHSLKAIRLVSQYHAVFNVKPILKDLFLNPTPTSHLKLLNQQNTPAYHRIQNIAHHQHYAISHAQRRVWILSQFEEASVTYNMPFQQVLDKGTNLFNLEKAILKTIERHEILRTIFKEDEKGEIKQWILSPEELNFLVIRKDFSDAIESVKNIQSAIEEDTYQPFDLENGPLLRCIIFKVNRDTNILYFNMHHIISDGWSFDILIRDVLAIYDALEEDKEPKIPNLRIQYKDYAHWQLEQFDSDEFKNSRAFWLKELHGELPVSIIPSLSARPSVQTYDGEALLTFITSETATHIKKYNESYGGSLFAFLMTVWNVLLFKYTGAKDTITGSPIAGRNHSELEDQIGFFVNTLPIRTHLDPDQNFNELYHQVKSFLLNAYEHQNYPFDQLIDDLNLTRDTSRNPLFDYMLTLQNTGENVGNYEGKTNADEIHFNGRIKAKFDIDLTFTEVGELISFDLHFNTAIYSRDMMIDLMDNYKNLLVELLDNNTVELNKIDYLNDNAKNEQLIVFNNTFVPRNSSENIPDLISRKAMELPNGIAISFKGKTLSYKELNDLSNQLTNYLIHHKNIGIQDKIAIQLDKSEWLIIVMLGVLKTGASYVPIDPELPVDRIEYMLNNSDSSLLIDEQELERFILTKAKYSTQTENTLISSDQLAYLIYTSGSTGQPKGVEITHDALTDYAKTVIETFNLTENDVVAQQSSIAFDVAVEEIFPTLVSGGKLVIMENGAKDIVKLVETIETEKITFLSTTPLVVNELNFYPEKLNSIRVLISGGDELKVNYISNLFGKSTIYNTYGPSEATVCATYHKIEHLDQVEEIGKPIANRKVYILNQEMQLLPKGMIGEICISGIGLARGYYQLEQLSKEKFLTNPFDKTERIYRTGDLGKWLPNGNIRFLGRIDNQVKIRGHRIEIGEIEHALSNHQSIKEAVVLATENNFGEKELLAFLKSEKELESGNLRHFLLESLPSYMVPSSFVVLTKFPLTTTGKIDRNALLNSTYQILESTTEKILPRNEIEVKLAEIWQETLGKTEISMLDDFFLLGGHSLRAVKILSRVNSEFDLSVKLSEIYNRRTIADMALLIKHISVVSKSSEIENVITDNYII